MIQKIMLKANLRYKPVIMEGIQYNGENMLEIEKLCKPYELYEKVYSSGFKSMSISFSVYTTPLTVCLGDWVIRTDDNFRDVIPKYNFDESYEIIGN